MQRGSIDLNKHALDLNEMPCIDLNLSLHDPSAPTSVSPLPFQPQQQLPTPPSLDGSEPFPVQKGGWLEHLRNIFGNGSTMSCTPSSTHALSGLNSNSNSCGAGEFSLSPWHVGKHDRILEGNTFPYKRLRTDDSLRQDYASFVSIHKEKGGNNSAENMNSHAHKVKFQQSCSSSSMFEDTSSLFKQDAIFKRNVSQGSRLVEADVNSLVCQTSAVVHKEKGGNNSAENMNSLTHEVKFHQSCSSSGMFEDSRSLFKQDAIFKRNVSQGSRLVEGDVNSLVSQSSAVVFSCMPGQEVLNQELKCQQNIECNSFCTEVTPAKDSTVKIIPSPEWLPLNWVTELKTRRTGNTAGTTDKYYKDPITGHRFRSKIEVMNYLHSGSVRRYKPPIRCSKGETPSSCIFQTEGSQAQLESDALFCNYFAFPIEKKNLDSSPVFKTNVPSSMPRFDTRMHFRAGSLPFEARAEESLSSQSTVLSEGIVMRQQEEEMPLFDGFHKCPKLYSSSPALRVQFEESKDFETLELSRSQGSVRNLQLNDFLELPSKYKCFNVKEGDPPTQYNTWSAYLSTPLSKSELQLPPYEVNGENAESSFFGVGRSWYGNRPGFIVPLLNTAESMQAESTRERVSKVDPVHLKGYNHMDRRKYQPCKAPTRKPINLTMKQSRELLILLGKKICLEYLESTRKTVQGPSDQGQYFS